MISEAIRAHASQVKPLTIRQYFESLSKGKELELLQKPCHDCAIKTGFYIDTANELLEQPEDLQDEVLKRWFCHNHGNCACRGAYNMVRARRKEDWEGEAK